MARLYSDEDFPRPVSEILRNRGHDVLTCQESARAGKGISDEAVLEYARSEKRAILTLNRIHFKKLHETARSHHGIVACTKNDNFQQLAKCIHDMLTAHPQLAGKLLRVYKPG